MSEKKKDFSKIKEELKKYRHCTEGQVQFAEVDSFGVVHNVQYLYWLEWARTLYFSEIGVDLNNHTYTKQFPIMVVHTEIDYLNPLHCFDKYKIFSRVSEIRNSSFSMENIVMSENGEINAIAKVVFVYLDIKNKQKTKLPEEIRKMIEEYEK